MLGYGFVFSSSEQHSLDEFFNNIGVSAEENDFLVSWGEIILMTDFFFTPAFSIYGEISLTLGYIEEHNGGTTADGIDPGTYSGFGIGASASLGIGMSF